jgi:DNA-binding MarR family transcriptional regulator
VVTTTDSTGSVQTHRREQREHGAADAAAVSGPGIWVLLEHCVTVFRDHMTAIVQADRSDPLPARSLLVLQLIHSGLAPDSATLSRVTGIPNSTLTSVIQDLVTRGLVERVEDPNSRRRKPLRIAPIGQAYVTRLIHSIEDEEFFLLNHLAPAFRAAVAGAVARLTVAVERATGQTTPRPQPRSRQDR